MKRKLLRILIVLVVLVALGFLWERLRWSKLPLEAPLVTGVVDQAWDERIGEATEDLVMTRGDLGVPALSIAVGVCGETVWSAATGWSDVASAEPATPRSRFRIGSVSKSVTSLLLAKEIADGRLDLDAPISDYIDYFPDKGHPITARQLAAHLSGVRHYKMRFAWPPSDFFSNVRYDTVEAAVGAFSDDELLFQPGTDYRYTTHGYTLLSGVLEGAGGDDFLTLMRREVFDPLGMDETGADHKERETPERVRFYDVDNGRYKPTRVADLSNKWAGGGFLSTPGDLVEMGNAIAAGRFLTAEVEEILFEVQTLSDGEETGRHYALGWGSQMTQNFLGGEGSWHIVSHGGSSMGGSAYFLIFPDEELTLALLTNAGTGSSPLRRLGIQIAEDFMRELLERGCAVEEAV